MEKSWEEKLAESKAKEAEEEKLREQEAAAKLAGTPHLLNLNEDPFLDRKVIYDIKPSEPVICGRRNKHSTHKLQLGGTGIEPEHCKFETLPNGSLKVIPLCERAMENIKINGLSI